ncbi:lipoprotein-anchoring transpeptidase ErfK/SrfK [Hamadaea flava]|uniref:Ig-like domain-containing protein n=1 Tax=Hamadaea flava TaxID=1742688 RepID=A0ABV8LL21_9ACTN|nr:Ig-like domain-containing protein [Hamadaea flava]MCP2323747.1 lipoprotein-anchoring transpeptidase ErfK/SrfK [Hamadaea flava]
MRRRTIFATAATAAAGTLLAACKDDPKEVAWSGPSGSPSTSTSPADDDPNAPTLTIAPAPGASVAPNEPVVVTAVNATLQTVTVTTGGKTVAGELDAEKTTWRSTSSLQFGKTYQVKASGVDSAGKPLEQTATFTTLKPSGTASITFQANAMTGLKNGGTYGVGQVVIVKFSKTPTDKKAALAAIKVTSEPQVEGRWYWVDNRTVHYRPEKFWAKGTKVSVAAKLHGVHLGKNVYGAENESISFTIGPARIAIADNATHYMRVTVDGVQVKNIPISMGKNGYVTTADGGRVLFPTRSGTHVVMSRELEHRMTSASYGVTDPKNPNYYDDLIKLCCRISYSGEFVHAAPWSVWAQGKQNVSHGCINIATSNAQWFYDNFRLGDPVIVKGTGRPQLIGDSAGAVWDVAWSKMTPES